MAVDEGADGRDADCVPADDDEEVGDGEGVAAGTLGVGVGVGEDGGSAIGD
jgi:hypothetical protein